jgi:pilus assembly protein Flp/PilA
MLFYPSLEWGQGLLEYSLVLALIAVIVIVVLALVGPGIGNMFSNVVNSI